MISKRESRWRWMAVAALVLPACGGTQPREPRSAGSEPGADEAPTAVLKAAPQKPVVKVSEDDRADFEKAVALYQRLRKDGSLKGTDCEEAAAAFRRVADASPTMLIARHNEASVYLECGKKQEAALIESELARKNYAPALTNLGYTAWQNGDVGQAESYFSRAIAADPQVASIYARINMAQILREKARHASGSEKEKYNGDAITQLRAVLALDGNSLQAYATLCYIFFDRGLPDAAILIGTQAIKRAEEIATGKFEDETVAESVNREKVAKGARGKGRKEAEEPKAAAGKGVTVAGTGWTPEMKKHIAIVHNTLGLVSLNKKSYKDAIPSFKRAVALDPELYEARLNLAAVSLRFRDYPTAEENFKAVVAAQPRNYEAIIGLGVALRGGKKFEEAEAQYQVAQKLDPSRPESYFNLGLLYQEYKGSEKPTLQQAQRYYRDFLAHSGGQARLKKDAEKRIKDIDELFVALEEAAKLQKEADELQRKAEEQQKKMEEEMKKQDEAAKKAGGAGAAAPAEPPAAPAGGTAPPAASPGSPPASAK